MNKRQERYRRNREKELAGAHRYYEENRESILEAQRRRYWEKINISRKKLREKQRKRRARLKQQGQKDTLSIEKTVKTGQKDTKKQ